MILGRFLNGTTVYCYIFKSESRDLEFRAYSFRGTSGLGGYQLSQSYDLGRDEYYLEKMNPFLSTCKNSEMYLLPDLVFVGINTLMSLGYLDGIELIIIPIIALIFGAAFVASTVGAIMTFAKYRSTRPKVYMTREMIIYGLTALCFVIHIVYVIEIILHPAPPIPELSTSPTRLDIPVVAIAGLVLCLAGMIVHLITGTIRNKRANAAVKTPAIYDQSVMNKK